MSLLLPAVLALAASGAPEVRAVRMTTIDMRTAMRVLTSEDVPGAMVVREGDDVVVTVAAPAAPGLAMPALEPPLQAIGVDLRPDRTILRIRVAREVPFEATHEPGMTTIFFGEQPAPELRGPVTPELYAKLFPTGVQTGERPPEETVESKHQGALVVGPVTLEPSLHASYVDSDVTFGSPTPVRERYLQVAPALTAILPVRDGQLTADYEPRLRFFSSIPELGSTSHVASAKLELPVGPNVVLHASDQLTRAVLEASVVDPGHEYFFDLSPYTANEASVGADVTLGPRLTALLTGSLHTARFDQTGGQGFFDYDTRSLKAGLGYDLDTELRAQVSYSYDSVPPSPERAIVETSAHTVAGSLTGSIGPLMKGMLSAGYTHRTSPLATGPSRSFDGLVLSGSLRRDLGYATSIELQASRLATLSAFETNAYYVNNSAGLSLNVPMPFQTAARGSVTWLQNDYPNDAAALGVPRRDRIWGWTVGLGRQLGSRSWLRFDYHHERRDSNLPGYDVTTDGFSVQLGISATGAQRP